MRSQTSLHLNFSGHSMLLYKELNYTTQAVIIQTEHTRAHIYNHSFKK